MNPGLYMLSTIPARGAPNYRYLSVNTGLLKGMLHTFPFFTDFRKGAYNFSTGNIYQGISLGTSWFMSADVLLSQDWQMPAMFAVCRFLLSGEFYNPVTLFL